MTGEIFYHGSGRLFRKFDLNHALEGDGKVKFGFGVYVTSSYVSAAHYSGANDDWDNHYVYSVEVPHKSEDNFIAFSQAVHPAIVARAEESLQINIPERLKNNGKEFRKFLAKLLAPKNVESKRSANLEGERLAASFLISIGVDFIEWPYSWKNPNLGLNRVILDESKVKIIRIDSVELDGKKKLISDSEKQIE